MEQEMLGSINKPSYQTSGSIFLWALLQERFYKKSHFPQHSNSRTRTIFLFCSTNRLLCGQNYFPQLLQKPVYGHCWINYLSCGILWNFFFCFLFIKLIVELIVTVLKHIEIQSLTGALLGSGKTLLSASYNLFSTSYLTSVFNPQAPLLQALEPTRLEDEIGDPKEEHLYPIVHHPTTALSLFD